MDDDTQDVAVRVLLWHPTRRTFHQFPSTRLFFRWAVDHLQPTVGACVYYVDPVNRTVVEQWAVYHDDRWTLTHLGRAVETAPLEPLHTPRQRQIALSLERILCLVESDAVLNLFDVDGWAHAPVRPHYMYGYTTPGDVDGRIEAWACPATIEAQTAHLADGDVDEYVSAIGIRMAKELGIEEQGRSIEETIRVVDQLLIDGTPIGWEILQAVEAKAFAAATERLGL